MKTPVCPFSCAATLAGTNSKPANATMHDAYALITRLSSSDASARFGGEVLIEPADDVLQPFDSMPRFSGARQLVTLTRKANHHGFALQVLQRAEEILAAGCRRCAEVLIAENEKQRRLDLLNVRDR